MIAILKLWKRKIEERKTELSIIAALFIVAAVVVSMFTYYDFQHSIESNKRTNEMLERIELTQQAGDIRTDRIDKLTQYTSEILAEQRFREKQILDSQLRTETDIQNLVNQATRITEAINNK